jgi:4-hydroxy-tetrahydrodipicolinate synthase
MFHGSMVAIVTPMKDSGEIDYRALERLVSWHLNSQTDGLVILGTTGESPTIEADERHDIITRVVDQVKGQVPVIVGSGANSTHHTIALTQQAMELGAAAALLVTPYYNKPTQEGLYQHYKAVAKAVPIPQILYNVPSRSACDLLPETVQRLGNISNIVALKEATGDLGRLAALLELDCQMDLLSGDDSSAMEFILAGGKGVISVTANVAPQSVHNMASAALEGDRVLAAKWNEQLEVLYQHLYLESNPIPTKWMLFKMGLIESGIRLPLTPLNERYHADLQSVVDQTDLA